MKEKLKSALDTVEDMGASYADARFVSRKVQSLETKNDKVEAFSEDLSQGVGIRVLYKGSWGFAGTNKCDERSIKETAGRALRLARAASRVKVLDVVLSEAPTVMDSYKTPFKIDPFSIPVENKIEILLDCDKIMAQEKQVKVREGSYHAFNEKKEFLSTEGSDIQQDITWCGAGISATATDSKENQIRSYPASFGGDYSARGHEFVDELELDKHAERISKEAVELLKAPQCPREKTTLILGGSQLALQIHESCGHPIELDRVIGMEASFAGTSFLIPDKKGNFQYGSDLVNLYADATQPGGMGTFGYDDEGIPAQKFDIVDEGTFVGYLTSRETSVLFEEKSNGTVRADGWQRMPMIRMTNINLKPDDWKIEELIKDTDKGVMLDTNRSWSIDQQRLNFQFGTEIAYKIEDGSIEGIYKNPTYTGITYDFWRSCDAITDKDDWRMWGIPHCGKGEPMQTMFVGHGCSTARFRDVQIGIAE
ncbi:MAG: TldD/PmbA family protein [Candidatus Eremiobacteraeota bacterium]|nr:TldD/PmbA family protein [Candidatus Eremiobacteraeota bacterium]